MFGLIGRGNTRAWEYALFEGKNAFLALPDVKLYAQLTEQQISNDCRIIMDSVTIYQSSNTEDTKKMRKKLVKERYKHLLQLKSFADGKQRRMIKEAEKAMKSV